MGASNTCLQLDLQRFGPSLFLFMLSFVVILFVIVLKSNIARIFDSIPVAKSARKSAATRLSIRSVEIILPSLIPLSLSISVSLKADSLKNMH